MSKQWLMLRGELDERTENSIKTNDDMWIELFIGLVGGNKGVIFFKSHMKKVLPIKDNIVVVVAPNVPDGIAIFTTHIFSRGGFPWQADELKAMPNTYKIRYGAGRRFIPEPDIKYDLVLCDTLEQIKQVQPNNAQLIVKPAATFFKPLAIKKEYDVCFIANDQQGHFKGTQFVYDSAPDNLGVLHLGYDKGLYNAPKNVTRKRVDRVHMLQEINKCKIAIFPYSSVDSCPRSLVECIACGLDVVALEDVNIEPVLYPVVKSAKHSFWDTVITRLNAYDDKKQKEIEKIYNERLNMNCAVNYLAGLIK